MNDPVKQFATERDDRIKALSDDNVLREESRVWIDKAFRHKYMYNFSWLGRPIIQFPADVVAMQELIWTVQPDLIIETGIAHGGSLILSASLLELNAACGGSKDARVLGIDIDIRSHNRELIEAHPMARRIDMVQGSSVDPDVVARAREAAVGKSSVLVFLDSNHTHAHVSAELAAYAPLVTLGSYCVAFDTIVEDMPDDTFPDRPWSPGNNPKTAVHEFVKSHSEFEIDHAMSSKLMISAVPDGFLRRVR
jgi:cephalosporin hydroxylase